MALSLIGWLSGLSASGVVIFGCGFGLFWMYKAKKTNAKLLFYFGLAICSGALGWFGDFVDFMTIIFTGRNMDNSYGLKSILGYIWFAPASVFFTYIAAELLMPEKKRFIVAIYAVLGVLYEIFLFLDPMGSFEITYPASPGEDIIDENIAFYSPLGITFALILLSFIILWVFGFLFKGIQSRGIIRKKFFLLSIGSFLWIFFSVLDGGVLPPGIATFFVRIGIVISIWIWYLGLREEPEKKEKIRPKKEVKVEGDLFRITKRPEQITEEEVSISKEKKICLVCKGKILGINYVCTTCESFYCLKCYEALSDLENACWACDNPLDESKPSKPFKEAEEEIESEISEKPQKKLKGKK